MTTVWRHGMQVYEVNRKLLQEHAAPLMAVNLHGVAVDREELNMDVSKKPVKGKLSAHGTLQLLHCRWGLLTCKSVSDQVTTCRKPSLTTLCHYVWLTGLPTRQTYRKTLAHLVKLVSMIGGSQKVYTCSMLSAIYGALCNA